MATDKGSKLSLTRSLLSLEATENAEKNLKSCWVKSVKALLLLSGDSVLSVRDKL